LRPSFITHPSAFILLLLGAATLRAVDGSFDAAAYVEHARQFHGDSEAGKRLVADVGRTHCLRCHKIGSEGSELGPNLSNVGGKLARDHLVESIIEPSRQIVEGFRGIVIATDEGRVLTGFAPVESDGQLFFIDAEGRRVSVALSSIDDRQVLAASPMPGGMAAVLTADEFCDLIAYLETLRAAGQSSPGSGVVGPISLPPGYGRQTIAKGLSGATALAVAPDGRVFVCEQTGSLRVVKNDRLLAEPFITLEVDDQWERGLIGVTLDPRFTDNGYVYVVWVCREPFPHHRVSRFTARGDAALADSEQLLFEGDDQTKLGGQVPAGHQGGAIHFGLDGTLFVAIGEQTAESPAQSLESLLGKILRFNADGTIPADNPFVHETAGKYRAIWARGCRNPYSFAVDPDSGQMLINDVGGQNEEINLGRTGANYGWPLVDHGPLGDRAASGDGPWDGPLFWYPQASICGGAFCPRRDGEHAFEAKYRGRYFFMDFVQGWIKTLDPASAQRPIPAEVFATGLARPVDLAFAPDGSLYVLLRDAWVNDGQFRPGTGSLHRIRPERN
jgi:putative heme-binding domain-containing protein